MATFYDSKGRLEVLDDKFIRHYSQDLHQDYLDGLKREQNDFKWNLDGFTKVASVPATVVDKWMNEGFNVHEAPAKEIIKRLRLEAMDQFVTIGNRSL